MTDDPHIAAVVLAAGRSLRMAPHHKLDLLYNGTSLIEHVVGNVVAARFERVVVVLGHRADAMAQRIGHLPVACIVNAAYADGLSGSVRLGFASACPGMDGILIMPADMPRITAEHLLALKAAFRPGRITVATDGGALRNPVILPAGLGKAVDGLTGDAGARRLFEGRDDLIRVEIGPPASLDVDTHAAALASGGLLPNGVN